MTEERKCDMMNSYIKNLHNLTGSSKSPDSIAKRNKQLFGYEQVSSETDNFIRLIKSDK